MGFILKNKSIFFVSLGIVILYFLLRLPTLLQIPLFTDEAIYIRWAQIANNDANWRFISLTDGKQPLFIWLMMLTLRLFQDPLIAGRMVSVAAGLGTMFGLFALTRELFKNKWMGITTAFLYAIYPFSLVYDRLALYDSLVGTFAIWGLYFSIRLVRKISLENAFILGFVTGLATLNKTNGFFTLYLLPSMSLFLIGRKMHFGKLGRFILHALVVVVMTYVIYSILRLSPYFYIIEEKNALFVYPLKEWLTHPFMTTWQNTTALFDWFVRYFGIPFTIASLLAFTKKEYLKEKIILVLFFAFPLVALAFFGRLIYPRYIFFMTLSLLPLVSYSLFFLTKKLKSSGLKALLFLLIISYSLFTSFMVLSDFPHSPIPRSDKGQLLTGWPAGIGVNESVAFFKEQASKEPIFIATQGTFGLMPYAYEIFLGTNKNVTIKGYWPIDYELPQEVLENAKKQKTYIVYYQHCPACPVTGKAPVGLPLNEVLHVKRLDKDSQLTVYEVRAK